MDDKKYRAKTVKWIKRGDEEFNIVDSLCFKAKNLYNCCVWENRQRFKNELGYLNHYDLAKMFRERKEPCFYALNDRAAENVIAYFHRNSKSYFTSRKNGNELVRFPHYLDKERGRFHCGFDKKAASRPAFRSGKLKFYKCDIEFDVPTFIKSIDDFVQLKIVPVNIDLYKIVVVYKHSNPQALNLVDGNIVAIDIGVKNFCTVVSNCGLLPFIISGLPMRDYSCSWNKNMGKAFRACGAKRKSTKRIREMTLNRNNYFNSYIHQCSRYLINILLDYEVKTLVIGYNQGQKNGIDIGKENNQKFVSLPHYQFIEFVKYKAEEVGINVIIREESYTSKCSFIDNEPIEKHDTYLGKRISRGMFQASDGTLINADVNAAFNILRKEFPEFKYEKGMVLSAKRKTVGKKG